ncbi:MAG: TetR/AcrR family transcriptional regulator [Candidatus Vecturithrix sp.]|nr:TetR/AcrR family transcriptional regulator [Candidatus Vecturithrix sp.]
MSTETRKPDKREAILEATLELIAEQGFDSTPISQIAAKAHVGIGSIYRYFEDKDTLIHALFFYVISKESAAVLKDYNSDAPIREQFMQLCSRIIQFSVQHPKDASFLEQYFHSPYGLSRRREEMLKADRADTSGPPLQLLFERAKAQQIVKNLPLHALGALTFGPLLILLRDIRAGLIAYDADLMSTITEACWDAIKL